MPSPGGIGVYTAKLVSSLSDLGVEVQPVVALHRSAAIGDAWAEFGLAGKLPPPARLYLPRAALYDAWHLVSWPPLSRDPATDLFHAPSLAVPPRGRGPLVVTVHDAAHVLFPEAFTARGRWFHAMGLRAATRRADLVITGSQAAAGELAEHTAVPAGKIRVVPYGVDQGPPEPNPSVLARYGLAGLPYVLWVGSMEPRKGVGTLVSAMARLLKGNVTLGDTALVLTGYAGWRNASLIAEEDLVQLGPALHRLGSVPARELSALYAGAMVFAFPSSHEGFGLPVLEAMAAGVPVVASDIEALAEVTAGAAVLVRPGDVDAWAGAIEALLQNPARRATLAERGRLRAAEFTWKRTASATLDVYREALGSS